MTESFLTRLLEQGGFALLCAALIWIYRHDSKAWAARQSETAAAYMAFGEKTATILTQVAETLRQQSVVLGRIDEHLDRNHLCPVTQVSSELLRDAADAGPARRKVEQMLSTAIARAAAERGVADGR